MAFFFSSPQVTLVKYLLGFHSVLDSSHLTFPCKFLVFFYNFFSTFYSFHCVKKNICDKHQAKHCCFFFLLSHILCIFKYFFFHTIFFFCLFCIWKLESYKQIFLSSNFLFVENMLSE